MGGLGLQTDLYSWALFVALVLLWLLSLKLVPTLKANGPIGLIYSFWGYVWLSFGIMFLLRFLILVYDSVNFGNESYRLADQTPATVNFCIWFLVLFWLCACVGLVISNRLYFDAFPFLHRLAETEWRDLVLFITFPSLMAAILSSPLVPVPLSLFTPLKLLTFMWILPASVLWWNHFCGRPVGRLFLFFVLTPPLVTCVLTPYREYILHSVLVIILAAAFAGRRIPFMRFIVGALAAYIAVSAVILTYRAILWFGETYEEATVGRDVAYYWMAPLNRFHAFDSLLLTVALVPDALPYSHRDVFAGSIVRGVIPRALYPEKEASNRAFQFSQTIWGFGDSEAAGASIAPSMPGDLYEAGGVTYVALGALIFGFVIGIFENTRKRLPLMLRCCFIACFAPGLLFAIERDFAHVMSTMIQTLLAANTVVFLLPTGWSRKQVGPVLDLHS